MGARCLGHECFVDLRVHDVCLRVDKGDAWRYDHDVEWWVTWGLGVGVGDLLTTVSQLLDPNPQSPFHLRGFLFL